MQALSEVERVIRDLLVLFATTSAMRFVKANGLVIHDLDQGWRDGPPLVRSHPSWRDWWPSTPGGPPFEGPPGRSGRPHNRLPRANGAEFYPCPSMG